VFHVLVGENGEVIGRFNLIDLDDGMAQLGYRVAQGVAGRGVATATVRDLCQRAADDYELRSLRAQTTFDNVASQRVLTNAGFVPDGPAEPGGRPGRWYRRDLAV
jgi:ribosomal-protein-alanine N-acetyltransferase